MASPPSLSLQTSRSTSIPDSTDHLSPSGAATQWTEEQEARLQYCQAELAKAHKRWSASQELWIEEYRCLHHYEKQVDHLTELRKAHLKAMKKQEVQAKKAVGIWKKRTWKTLSRTSSRADTTVTTPVDDTDADDEGDEDGVDEDALSPIERTDTVPESPTSPTLYTRKSSLSNAVRRLSIAGLRGRRRVSAGNSNAVSANQSGAATPALDGVFV